jgi:hypothetical protein
VNDLTHVSECWEGMPAVMSRILLTTFFQSCERKHWLRIDDSRIRDILFPLALGTALYDAVGGDLGDGFGIDILYSCGNLPSSARHIDPSNPERCAVNVEPVTLKYPRVCNRSAFVCGAEYVRSEMTSQ